MDNQTKNRIREEFLEWCKEDPALELANGVGSFENIADWFLPKITELLKLQRDSLVDRLPECAWCDLENGRGKYLLESDIISLIKNN